MRGKDAPKIVNAGVWSAAVIGALAFSISLGAYLFGGLDNEISADTETPVAGAPKEECATNTTMYTIHNYPGTANLIGGTHAGYYQDNDINWRCSYVCVPDGTELEDYLKDATIDGKPITLAKDPDDFNDNIFKKDPKAAMTITVILSEAAKTSSRQCKGNSKDYGIITNAQGIIDTVDRQESAYKETEAARQEAISGAGTIAGVPVPLEAAVSGGSEASQTESSTSDLSKCKSYINNFLVNYENNQNMESDFYNGIKKFYIELKLKEENNNQGILELCNTYKSTIQKYLQSRGVDESDQSKSSEQQGQCTAETLNTYIQSKLKELELKKIMLKFVASFTANNPIRNDICQDQITFIDDFNNNVNEAASEMNEIVKIYGTYTNIVKGETNNGIIATLIKDGEEYIWSTRVKITARSETRKYSTYVYFRAFISIEDKRISPMSVIFSPYYNQATNWLGQPIGITYAKMFEDSNRLYQTPPFTLR